MQNWKGCKEIDIIEGERDKRADKIGEWMLSVFVLFQKYKQNKKLENDYLKG